MERYPGIIAGVKDSSNDAALQAELFRRHPELLVYPSSEAFLNDARALRYAGCISGTVSLWPELAARVWNGDASAQSELTQRRENLCRVPIIAGVRYVLALRSSNRDWQRCLPPISPLSEEQTQLLHALVT
jgi:4-hydroxy-tetrahydrodipicolinate synthase